MYFFETDSRPIQHISIAEFNAIMSQRLEVLEQDRFGIKVIKLANGHIFKVFRVKRWWSGANVYSYAQRFSRNIYRLKRRNIPTPTMQALYRIQGTGLSAVEYIPLAGETIKDLVKTGKLTPEIAFKVGAFMAKIHDLGIYFRGLHIGNIVLTPANELGLIDVSELSIYNYKLGAYRRLRNFARFWREKQDKINFGADHTQALIHGYMHVCKAFAVSVEAIQKRLQ
jgi:tRNA A-37 threonylcarbamoyl transferase component Bud32